MVVIKRIFVFIAALLSVISVGAKVWSADDIPMVHLQDRNRYVCDPDGIMTTADRDSADFYLRKMQLNYGVQTVFIVVNNVKDADCFRMAQDVGNKYGVGDKKNRRGLVIVIAVNDRRYFIAPGKGLEGELTDVECDDIARACIVKNMKVNDTDAAVVETVKALYRKFSTGDTGLGYDDAEESDSTSVIVIIFLILLFFGRPIYLFIRQILEDRGIIKRKNKKKRNRHRNDDDDWFPPFIFGGGGGFSSGGGGFSSGGSFGGGSFGGGGAGGGW